MMTVQKKARKGALVMQERMAGINGSLTGDSANG